MTEVGNWNGILVALAVATAALLLLAVRIRKPRRRLPPGPPGWPILGNLLSLGTEPHKALQELSKKYGPLMLIRLGSIQTVVVSSPEMAEEIYKKNDQIMSSRPSMVANEQIFYGHPVPLDIAWSPYGQQWRYVRKICTIGLLTGARLNQFREIREQEVLASLHFMLEESKQGNAVNMGECFSITTANNMTQMLMNKSYCTRTSTSNKSAVSDGMSAWLHEAFQEMFVLLGTINISDCVPFLKPFDLQGLQKRAKVLHEKLDDFFQKILDERRQTKTTAIPGKEDFVDALLGFGQTKEFQERLSEETIKAILLDMVSGASDTSSVTAEWVFAELMRHPKVMRRVQEELDTVVGQQRLVQEEDLPNLTYLSAVISETLRLHPPGPLLVPRESTEDCEIQGFHIPAKTRIISNYWAIHRDPAVWERPLEFDPDRFVNSKIDFTGHDFKFLPFGSGRRRCPGVNLGVLMVLSPLALLLHAADWKTVEGQKPEELDISETFGLVLYKRHPLILYGKARLPNHVIYPAQQASK